MSNEEINKYLTEVMGECWHDCRLTGDSIHTVMRVVCKKCNTVMAEEGRDLYRTNPNNNFFTWQGFGKLWEWATKQEWWLTQASGKIIFLSLSGSDMHISTTLVTPTNFAKAIYEFLKER